jgi:PPP family 3-phenylpropionic acid transporter
VYFGPGKVLTFACLVSVGRWLFFSQEDSLELILWLQPLHAISFGLMWVSAMGVLKREVGMQGTGTAQGLYASAVAVGATLGLASWGIVFERFGSSRVFTIAAGIMACAALLASRLIQLTRPGVGGSVETETIKKAA